jgi:nitrous oxide reductase accessory protein NosL
MLVSSDNGASEIVSSTDDTRFYDDVGCLAADWHGHRGNDVAFVHLPGGRWIDAEQASYARPVDARTAMGSGFVAYATAAEARTADRDGRALAFDDVVRLAGVSP